MPAVAAGAMDCGCGVDTVARAGGGREGVPPTPGHCYAHGTVEVRARSSAPPGRGGVPQPAERAWSNAPVPVLRMAAGRTDSGASTLFTRCGARIASLPRPDPDAAIADRAAAILLGPFATYRPSDKLPAEYSDACRKLPAVTMMSAWNLPRQLMFRIARTTSLSTPGNSSA